MQAVDTVRHWLTGSGGRRWLLQALLGYAAIGFVVWIQRPGDFGGYLALGNVVLSGRPVAAVRSPRLCGSRGGHEYVAGVLKAPSLQTVTAI
jgi:hypothetical protein